MKKTAYIHPIIILALMLGIGFLPPVGVITPFGMQVLGVFIGCIYAWVVGIATWPTLLAFILLAILQNQTLLTVFQSAMGNQNLWLIVWGFAFCYAIDKCGLIEVIGKFLISRDFVRKSPYWMLFAFWMTCWATCTITSASMTIAIIIWAIFYDVMKQVGIERYSKYSAIAIIGMAIASYLGSCVMPYNKWQYTVNGIFKNIDPNIVAPGFMEHIIVAVVISALYFVAAMAVTKFILRPETDFDVNSVKIDTGDLKLLRSQKVAIVAIVTMVVILIGPFILPTEWFITKLMSWMGNAGAFMLVVIIMSLTPKDDGSGEKVVNVYEAVRHGMNWQMFFMLALCFYLASLLTAASTGIMAQVTTLVTPILAGRSAFVTLMLFAVVGMLLTNAINNLVCITILAPIAVIFASTNGVSTAVIMILFAIILLQGCIMPSGSAMGALLHGNMEYLKANQIFLYATVYLMVLAVITGLVAFGFNAIL